MHIAFGKKSDPTGTFFELFYRRFEAIGETVSRLRKPGFKAVRLLYKVQGVSSPLETAHLRNQLENKHSLKFRCSLRLNFFSLGIGVYLMSMRVFLLNNSFATGLLIIQQHNCQKGHALKYLLYYYYLLY